MNAKKLIAAAVLGTLVTVTATTQVATAAVYRRPVVYHHPVYGAYWNAPYYYPGYTVTVPAPTVYNYATVSCSGPVLHRRRLCRPAVWLSHSVIGQECGVRSLTAKTSRSPHAARRRSLGTADFRHFELPHFSIQVRAMHAQ